MRVRDEAWSDDIGFDVFNMQDVLSILINLPALLHHDGSRLRLRRESQNSNCSRIVGKWESAVCFISKMPHSQIVSSFARDAGSLLRYDCS